MNVSGHRISTIEVESALVDHQEVAEAAVAARNDATTGQAIVAFVTLKGGGEGSVEKLEELRNHVAQKIGPIAKPANIVFTPELPKTRSGKIMRRLLRDVAENRPLGDTTTLADPTVVDELRARGQDEQSKEASSRLCFEPHSRSPAASSQPFIGLLSVLIELQLVEHRPSLLPAIASREALAQMGVELLHPRRGSGVIDTRQGRRHGDRLDLLVLCQLEHDQELAERDAVRLAVFHLLGRVELT